MIQVAGVLHRHLDAVLNCVNRRITNAVSGGLNAKIQWNKYFSRWFRDRERFKLEIYLHAAAWIWIQERGF